MSGTDYLTGLKGKQIPSEAGNSIYHFLKVVSWEWEQPLLHGAKEALSVWDLGRTDQTGCRLLWIVLFLPIRKNRKELTFYHKGLAQGFSQSFLHLSLRDLGYDATYPLLSHLGVCLTLFCGICFPKMKLSPGKGAETSSQFRRGVSDDGRLREGIQRKRVCAEERYFRSQSASKIPGGLAVSLSAYHVPTFL